MFDVVSIGDAGWAREADVLALVVGYDALHPCYVLSGRIHVGISRAPGATVPCPAPLAHFDNASNGGIVGLGQRGNCGFWNAGGVFDVVGIANAGAVREAEAFALLDTCHSSHPFFIIARRIHIGITRDLWRVVLIGWFWLLLLRSAYGHWRSRRRSLRERLALCQFLQARARY